jgi:DNA-binding response OmpR family regulator/two-component sensor histidine kinase
LAAQKNRIESQKEKLQELDKAKSSFFTNISHEFRTPLTVISGLAEKLKEENDAALQIDGQVISRNSKSLLNLVNQILDLRKLESGELKLQPQRVEVIGFTKYLFESFHSMFHEKGISQKFNSTQDQFELDLDPDKWQSIVINLISNAFKFTPQDGLVEISLDVSEQLNFTIMDTGVGIPKEKQELIFNRFYQVVESTVREGEGTGIGLTYTKQLVKLMGGNIKVESQENMGATFSIALPISHASTEDFDSYVIETLNHTPEINVTTESTGLNKDRILVVEDNVDVANYLKDLLKSDYQISHALNGEIGVQNAIEQIPDIIISDVIMPKKDGFQLVQELKNNELTNHIPIVMLTAKADVDSKLQGLEFGADAYLPKPFDKRELKLILKNIIKARAALRARYANITEIEVTPEAPAEDEFVVRIREIVLAHLSDSDFKVPQLCEEAGISRSQLHNKIKALTGLSSTHFINKVKIEKAEELIKSTTMSMQEIGFEVGYNSISHFYRSFSQIHGVSPCEFKDNLSN